MTEEQSFLKVILENQADDVCRLVYADWLQGNGRQDRADFIRNQIERAAGGVVEIDCENCEGTGELIDPAGPCPNCGGQFESREDWTDMGWSAGSGKVKVPDTSAARMRYVSESLARDEKVLKRWGLKWLPRCARGQRCQLWQVVGDHVQVIDSNGRADLYVFERGFMTFATINLPDNPSGRFVGLLARSILSAHPVRVLTFEGLGRRGPLHLTTYIHEAARCWVTMLHPLNRPSGAAVLNWPDRREMVQGVVGFVREFWADVPAADPEPREY